MLETCGVVEVLVCLRLYGPDFAETSGSNNLYSVEAVVTSIV